MCRHFPPNNHHFLVFLAFLFVSISCRDNTKDIEQSSNETLPEEKNSVETVILTEQDFEQEIVSNGKLAAIQRAELYFENPGLIETINAKNGQLIKKGFLLSKLINNDYRFNLKKAELSREKARIDKLDALIGMGYKQTDTEINPEHEAIADIRSGYQQAVIQHEEAKMQLERTQLLAPFSGKVEGITQRSHEKANLSQAFCTLINDKRFYINFPLLETEISKVKEGQKVNISPIAGAKQTTGTVTEINPRVDENGLVWLKAEINNPGGYIEGMNVKVSIKKAITQQLVVPKQSVVLRQNREVLFRYTKGTAYWTYINVLDENENQYSVVAAEGATLELGDTVIISNNLNLAHESEVEMK